MSHDRYKIEVIHIFHPHLIWIKIKDSEDKEEFKIEQVGLYGLLPLEISVNTVNNTIQTLKCTDWIPAATSYIKKIVSESTEIWFIPTLIDRRVSIFDDSIHKYGEFQVKKSNKFKSLSELLIKSSLAHEDICLFHQKLSKGEIKTKLSNIQIEEVIKHFLEYFQSKGIPKKVWEKVLNLQMSVFFCSQQFELALTESNLEKHNNLIIKRVLENKMKDLNLCKDVEEESIGRASYKVNESNESQLPSDLLKRELHLAKRNKVQDASETYNNIKKFLDDNSKHFKKFDNVCNSNMAVVEDALESNQCIVKENNKLSLRLQKLNNIKKSNHATTLMKEKQVGNDIVINEDLKMKKIVKENNKSPKVMKNHVIYGPPGINPTQFKINTVPQAYDDKEPQNKIIDKERDDEHYNINLGEVESEINIDVSNEVMKKILHETYRDNKFDNKNTLMEVFDSSAQDDTSSSSSLMLQKRLRLNKKKDKSNESAKISDKDCSRDVSTFEDSSKKDDSIDEDIDKVMDRLNKKYLPISIDTQMKEMDQQKMVNTKLKNHVNPFQNIDPNISVFVDKLVTPILMVHSKLNKRIEPVYEMRDVNFNSHIQLALLNMAVKRPMMLQTISWFTVLRGYSLFMISPMGSGKTIGYLPAVCRLITDYSQVLVDSLGPIGIIVCATAESVAHVEKTAKMFLDKHERVVSCYAGIDDLDITTRLLNKCDLFICTPPALVRLMKATEFGIDLRRLCTFILDDCERLTVAYTDEIKLFLLKIKEMMKNRALRELKVQFILASRVWCDFMGPLAKKAPDTVICIGAFQECVLYSKANTSVSFVKPENKVNHVSQFLKLVDGSKRTIIVCRSDDEVRMITKALKRPDNYIFSCDTTMTVQDLYNLNISWTEYEDPSLGPLLICCDDNLTHMNITNAHNLIHYSLPSLFSMFCKRFSVLNDHYPSIFNKDSENIHIKILLEETNIEQLPKIINFIKRCTDSVPDVLNVISERVLIEKDARKAQQLVPICNNLLGLGYCPDMYNCHERHTIFKEHDMPKEWLPKKGVVAFKILHYHSAVSYSARLLSSTVKGVITKYPQTYNTLSMKMSMYYSKESNRKLHGIPEVGDTCAVSIKQNFFVRCQVMKILNRYQKGNPNHVLVNLIDEEKIEITRDIYLYHMPDEIKNIKTSTVQVRLANIQPLDKDITYSKLAKKHVKKITESEENLYLKGNICLIIGNCIFIEDLEVCEDLTSLSKTVVKYNIIQELLGKHAMSSFDHITKLMKLCVGSDLEEEQEVEPAMKDDKKIIAKANWAHLEIDEISCVFFDSAISPDTFFVRLDKFESCMTDLIKEIQKYANNNMKPLTTVVKGDLVLAKFPDDSTYERARVDDIVDNGKIKCFFVDYGDWRDVPFNHLVTIPEKFINQLPFQAIECRLISIQPPGKNWSDFSTNWLCDNCLKDADAEESMLKRMYVKYFTKGQADFTGGYKYGVVLIDTNSDQDIIINKIMIDLNLAQANPEEIEYLNTFDLTTMQADTAESLDEDEWEKVTMNSSKTELNTQSHVFMQKPLRSIPLIGSDEESDDSDRWNIHMTEDLKGFFLPAFNKVTEQTRPQPLAIKDNEHKESTKHLPGEDNDVDLHNHCFNHIKQESETPKVIELDSDDLTSSVSGKSEQNSDQSSITHVHELRRPKVVWQQNKKNVTIKIQIIVDKDYELKIEDMKLTFKAHANDTNYGFDMELYGVVDTQKCSHANKGQYVLIKLTKVLNKLWLNLTRDGTIKKWITYDVDNIDTSSDEEVLDGKPMENIIKGLHYRTESESDDNEIIDDANFIYKKS